MSDIIDHMRLAQYVHIWAFQDMGLILMTPGISIYGLKGTRTDTEISLYVHYFISEYVFPIDLNGENSNGETEFI